MAQMVEDTVYVAVGKDIEESQSTLRWALNNFPGKKLGLLYVHQPSTTVPLIGHSALAASQVGEDQVKAYQELERQIMHKILDGYLGFCLQAVVGSEKLYIEMDDIQHGIVELIRRHSIKKLVMGAAANEHYFEGMTELQSMKAIYVHHHSPLSCQIWFTCKGILIQKKHVKQLNPADQNDRDKFLAGISSLSLKSTETEPLMQSRSHQKIIEAHGNFLLDQLALPWSKEDDKPRVPNAMVGLVAENSKGGSIKDILKYGEAEQSATKTFYKAEALESLYTEELRHRMTTEEELVREKESIKKDRQEWEEVCSILIEEVRSSEDQVEILKHKVKELESMEEVSRIYKKERDDLWVELENVHKEKDGLLKDEEERKLFTKFSYLEIQRATNNFDPSLKIGQGGYGTVYKGVLHQTPVAIKVLNADGRQGPEEFWREVDILKKLRHPNVVTLIGVCAEACALIYEYLPNGSLEDRLNCEGNSQPLSWQSRIRIATELCSVLIFMHSLNSGGMVHGDLNPANVLLDANLVSKLSGFGICPTISSRNKAPNGTTELRGTFNYMDPHYLETGELSSESNIYSFGTILLQLLTGRSSILEVIQEMEAAIEEGNLMSELDTSAGDLPFVQAEQLARLALRCCNRNPDRRPDLASEMWRVLDSVRYYLGTSSPTTETPEVPSSAPSYFICPISQEVMENPRVAADGFTYEEEHLIGWLDSGKDTSPMTNLKLEHTNLVPNYALRSAILEWRQSHTSN